MSAFLAALSYAPWAVPGRRCSGRVGGLDADRSGRVRGRYALACRPKDWAP